MTVEGLNVVYAICKVLGIKTFGELEKFYKDKQRENEPLLQCLARNCKAVY